MRELFLLVGLFVLNLQGFAGETDSLRTKKAKHEFHLGIGHHQFREKNLHNKPYRGISYQLAYEIKWTNKNHSTFHFSIQNSHNKINIEKGLSNMNASIRLGYEYLWNVCKKDKWKYSIGPASFINYNASYLPNWDESHLYWSNSLHLNVNQRLEFMPSTKHKMALHIHLPLIGALSRPDEMRDYKMDDLSGKGILSAFHSQVGFSNLINNFQLYGHVDYTYHAGNKGIPTLYYQFIYLNLATKNSRSYSSINHSIGLKWQF